MLTTKQDIKEDKFQSALEYLGEYRGVKGVVIFDIDGLVLVIFVRIILMPRLFRR
jgi:hypothetical protein